MILIYVFVTIEVDLSNPLVSSVISNFYLSIPYFPPCLFDQIEAQLNNENLLVELEVVMILYKERPSLGNDVYAFLNLVIQKIDKSI